MGIKDSEKCEFCGEKDHLEHYFFHCKKNTELWKDVSQILTTNLGTKINLTEQIIILGIEQDIIFDKLNNKEKEMIMNIILIGKLSIIKSKLENVNINLIFEKEMRIRKWNTQMI